MLGTKSGDLLGARDPGPNSCKLRFRNGRDRPRGTGDCHVDKDRIEGSAKQVKGTLKIVAGKILGDAKLVADGKADKAKGAIQNAIGGAKDTMKD